MQKVKIFLASSQELKVSRDEFEKFIRRKNDSWLSRNIRLQLIIWEDFIDVVSQTRKQDDYNKAIRESDILLVLVFSKIGLYTKEEFEAGYEHFLKIGKPLIYTYFQVPWVVDGLTREESNSVYDFQERLKQIGHFKGRIKSIEDLLLQFGEQLDKLYPYTGSNQSNGEEIPHKLNNIPRHDEEFIGRFYELERLDEMLQNSKRVVLMNGMGGIGKTTLAKKYVQNHLDSYDHISWVEVKSEDTGGDKDMTIIEAFVYDAVLIKNLGIYFTNEDNESRFKIICNTLSNLEGKNLLIIDNGREDIGNKSVKNILPGPPRWQVLITSRQSFSGFEQLDIDKLQEKESIELFRTHYTKEEEDEVIKELLKEIDNHTLTIELIAKTLGYPGQTLSVKETIRRLKDKKMDSPALKRIINSQHGGKETDIYIHLVQTFNLLPLEENDKWLMKQFAFLPPRQYKISEIENFLDINDETAQKELHQGLSNLAKKGWLRYEQGYEMHRMVQQMVHYQLEPGLKDIEALVNKLTDLLYTDVSTDFTKLFFLIPYAEYISSQLKKDELNNSAISLLQNNMAVVRRNLGEYEKAKDLLEASLASDLKNFGEQHHDIAVRQSNLAKVYRDLGMYEKARDLLEASLASNLKNFGEEHSNVAFNRSNLANVYRDLGEYEKAKDLLEISLARDLKNFGEQHPTVAVDRSDLATVYRNLNEYEKAKDLLKAALSSDLKNFGEHHPTVAVRRSNLANVYRDLHEYEKARDLLEVALASTVRNFGEQHPTVAVNRSSLASVYRNLGEYEKARDLLEVSLASATRNFGERHPSVAIRFNNLAWVYVEMNNFMAAKNYFEKAIDIFLNTVGPDHPNTKATIDSLDFVKSRMKE